MSLLKSLRFPKYDCQLLEDGTLEIDAYYHNEELTEEITGPMVIPAMLGGYRVTSIGIDAFSYEFGSTDGITLILQEGILRIRDYAFRDSNIKYAWLPDGLTEIGDFAFSDCSLLCIRIPETAVKISPKAFLNLDCFDPKIVGKKGSYAETYARGRYRFEDFDWDPYSEFGHPAQRF